jgi:hypothetical protein
MALAAGGTAFSVGDGHLMPGSERDAVGWLDRALELSASREALRRPSSRILRWFGPDPANRPLVLGQAPLRSWGSHAGARSWVGRGA